MCTRDVSKGGLGRPVLYLDTESFFTEDVFNRFYGYFSKRWNDLPKKPLVEAEMIPNVFELGKKFGIEYTIIQEESRVSAIAKFPSKKQIEISKGKPIKETTQTADWLQDSPIWKDMEKKNYGLIVIDSITVPIKSVIPKGCLQKGTYVLIKDKGYIPIEQVQVGDLVYSSSGKWRRVLQIIHNKIDYRPSYQIIQYGGQRIVLTSEHPILIGKMKWDQEKKEYTNEVAETRWISAEELYEISSKFSSPYKLRRRFRAVIPRTPEGSVKERKELGRVLGFALGDGCITEKDDWIQLFFNPHKERKLAERYIKLVENLGLINKDSRITVKERQGTLIVSFSSTKLAKMVREFKNKPEKILEYPKEFAFETLKGLIEADGWEQQISSAKPNVQAIIPLAALHADMFCSVKETEPREGMIEGRIICGKKAKRFGFTRAKISKCGRYLLKTFNIEVTDPLPESYNLAVEEDESYFVPSQILHNTQHLPGRGTLITSLLGTLYPIAKNFNAAILVTDHITRNPMSPGYVYGVGDPWGGQDITYYIKYQYGLYGALKEEREKYGPDGPRLRRLERHRYPGLERDIVTVMLALDQGYTDLPKGTRPA